MSNRTFRGLTNYEKKILEKLLAKPFPGRDQLQEQIKYCRVRPISEYKDNYGSIEFKISSDVKANVNQRVPVEGVAYEENVPIEVLLHVVDGKIDELEFVKMDGSPIKKMPDPENFKVMIRTKK